MIARFLNYIGCLLFFLPITAASASNKSIIPPNAIFSFKSDELQNLMQDSVKIGIELAHENLVLELEEENLLNDFIKENQDLDPTSKEYRVRLTEFKSEMRKKRKNKTDKKMKVLFNNYVKPQIDEKKDSK